MSRTYPGSSCSIRAPTAPEYGTIIRSAWLNNHLPPGRREQVAHVERRRAPGEVDGLVMSQANRVNEADN